MSAPHLIATRDSYDQVAEEYAHRIYHELEHKPLDRALLDRFAAALRDAGLVCDLGCGPGHVARYLHERGVNVFGIDLSPLMLAEACHLNPGLEFRPGDMLALDLADAALDGIVAFYSIIHLPRSAVTTALAELRRVLRPDGQLLLAFHLGQEDIHLDEWWGKQVLLDAYFFGLDEMSGYLHAAGLVIEDVITRPPYEGVEYPSQRAYIFARHD